MKTLNKRVVVSLILLVTLIMMPVSAAIIHITHGTTISHTWLHLHVLFAVTFTAAGIFHVACNRRALKYYLFGDK
ncbi:MAG: hypothetical protein FWF13_06330 [Acidobacteria bacterium]|nr:hypothetical protein [Acidobacteriota bacterium]